MKILLVGEYSRLHNSLKEGLEGLGHQVSIIATGDYFKDYPADIKFKRKYDTGVGKKIKVGLFKLFGVDITSLSLKKQFFSIKSQLQGYDIIQLINESPFNACPKTEKQFISFLKKNNKKLFLLSCGTDHLSVKFSLSDSLPYSILDGYKKETFPKSHYDFALKYMTEPFKKLHDFVYEQIEGVIASDLDYHLPLKGHPKYLGLIPNPINIDKLKFNKLQISNSINIFLGINRNNYHTKGINFFEEALDSIQKKYGDKIQVDIVENLPYSEYIERYNNAHIILDQVLGYDQGYNALEAMAKGKVVFTGAEKEFVDYYDLKETVAVNVLPDSHQIYIELEKLILNPDRIIEIGGNARSFIEKEHHYKNIANKYLNVYTST